MGVWSRLRRRSLPRLAQSAEGLALHRRRLRQRRLHRTSGRALCASGVQGVDPSRRPMAFARQRHTAEVAEFREGDAMALPFADKTFDLATMALVIFFVPDPAKGVAEMKRVVRSGGTVAAYAWDLPGGGFPLEPLLAEIRAMGHKVPQPPSAEASRMAALRDLWSGAGLASVETREIAVERTFPISTSSGPRPWRRRASPPPSRPCRPPTSNGSRLACATSCRRMRQGALPMARAPMRQRPRAVLGFGMASAARSR